MADESKEVNPDLEKNSGVNFPGESVEPILGAATNVGDDTLEEAYLVVEYVAKKEDKFAFSFLKN